MVRRRYGNGYWGVTEANYLLVIINWITAAVGPWLWAAPAFDVLPFDPPKWLHPRIASATVNEFVITFVSFHNSDTSFLGPVLAQRLPAWGCALCISCLSHPQYVPLTT